MMRLYGRSIGANEDHIHESILARTVAASRVQHEKTARMLPDGGVGDVQPAPQPTGHLERPSSTESDGAGH